MAKTLTRDAILTSPDIKTEIVEVPEWGGSVCVKALTGTERDAYETSLIRINKDGSRQARWDNIRAKLCAFAICDPETKAALFSPGDIEILGTKSASALDRVFDVAQRLSGMGAQDVAVLMGNSGTDRSDTSTSS